MTRLSNIKKVIIFILIPVLIFGVVWFLLGSGDPNSIKNFYSKEEFDFLKEFGFLDKVNSVRIGPERAGLVLKSPGLIEQGMNRDDEAFQVLATDLNLKQSSYQVAFRLENKSSEKREFHLIPVSRSGQIEFTGLNGVINNQNNLTIGKDDVLKDPLEELYDTQSHKSELIPELAQAYHNIKYNRYQASPTKVVMAPGSVLLAKADFKISLQQGSYDLEPVYFLIEGSAAGMKDDLVILDVHSRPDKGENWEISFQTRGLADLKISPNDQATIDDDEFIGLFCDDEPRSSQILQNDVISYQDWECDGTGKVVHYTKKKGDHTLRFEFNGQTSYAYNSGDNWLDGWNNRKLITIQDANIDSNLTDFPLHIGISADSDMSSAQADGDDIRFTDSDGDTLLNYEEEAWSGGGGSAVTATFWVEVPNLYASPTGDQNKIYIYYNNPAASDSQNSAGVWSANYGGVWHLNESSGSAVDSANSNDGTFVGDLPDTAAGGKIDDGQDFDGNSDYITLGNDSSIVLAADSSFTISAWILIDNQPGPSEFPPVFMAIDSEDDGYNLFQNEDTGTVICVAQSDTYVCAEAAHASIGNDTWRYISGTFDTSDGGLEIFVDGSSADTNTSATYGTIGLTNVVIGRWSTDDWDGQIDEVRFNSDVRTDAEIKFEYYNMNESDYELTWGSDEVDEDDWLNGWTYRKLITVQDANIDSNLTDFPLYIRVSADSDLSTAESTGADIRFTDNDGETLLSYEIESWSGGGGSAATADFWVKVPNLYASPTGSQNQIYMYYDNDGAPDGQNSGSVWSANYEGVWHFSEGSGNASDSTANGYTGTVTGATWDDVNCRYDNCLSFDGTGDYVDMGDVIEPPSKITISAWINGDDLLKWQGDDGEGQIIVRKSGNYILYIYDEGASTDLDFYVYGPNSRLGYAVSGNLSNDAWYYLSAVYDGSDQYIYVNGSQAATKSTTGSITTGGSNPLRAGALETGDWEFDGHIDEVRINNDNRTAAEVKFEYYNMNESDHELTIGSESSLNSAPTITEVEDYADPEFIGNTITFSVDWNDTNSEGIKMLVCKTDSITAATPACGGGEWCSDKNDYDTSDPIDCSYTLTSSETGSNNYYVFVCDDEPACSGSTSGTFTGENPNVNSFKFEGGTTIDGNVIFK